FLSPWKDQGPVHRLDGAQQATLSHGLLRVFALSSEVFVGLSQFGPLAQRPIHLFPAAAQFLCLRPLPAQVSPFPLAASFLVRLLSSFSLSPLPVSAIPRLLHE